MGKYAVAILGPSGNPHVEAFRHPARVLAAALRQLGHDVGEVLRTDGQSPEWWALGGGCGERGSIGTFDPERDTRVVVFGAVHAAALRVHLPRGAVVYNLEQARSGWFHPDYVRLCRAFPVWDYNVVNAARMREHGVVAQAVVELGDVDPSELREFERDPPDRRTCDVALVGYRNERRMRFVDDARELGLSVEVVDGNRPGDYGWQRDELLARCKLAVNVHYYEPDAVFESARCSYLVANGVPVLSERSLGTDTWAVRGVCTAPYERLPAAALALARDPAQLERSARDAAADLRAYSPLLLHSVREALERSAT